MIIIGEPNPRLHDILCHAIENKNDLFFPVLEDNSFIMDKRKIDLIADEFFENIGINPKNKIPFYKTFKSKTRRKTK